MSFFVKLFKKKAFWQVLLGLYSLSNEYYSRNYFSGSNFYFWTFCHRLSCHHFNFLFYVFTRKKETIWICLEFRRYGFVGCLAYLLGECFWCYYEFWTYLYEFLGLEKMAEIKLGNPFVWIDKKLAIGLVFLIHIYQRTFSPDHGVLKKQNIFVGCRFYPSCSMYSVQALQKYGFVKGLLKTIWRILRCLWWTSITILTLLSHYSSVMLLSIWFLDQKMI